MIKTLVLSIIILMSCNVVQAEDVFDIAAQYNKKKNKVLDLETKKRKILSEIYRIEKETNKLVIQKTEMDEKKFKLDSSLRQVSKRIVAIEASLQEMTPELTERLAFVEQINNLPWFYTLLTSQSVTELDHLFETAKKINSAQADQVLEFIGLFETLEAEKLILLATAREIVELKKDILGKEKNIGKNQHSKNKFLRSLERSINAEKSKLKNIKGKGRRAVAMSEFKNLGLLFGTGFFDKKGQLPHPIKMPISHFYGLNKGLRQDHIDLIHKGNFYSAPLQASVKAVASGRVRYVNNVSGLGKVVLIDHGGRYYTVYGNLKKVSVKEGQVVKASDLVGSTGHVHLQLKAGLYFEIRHFSQPQNPASWLKPREGHLATL